MIKRAKPQDPPPQGVRLKPTDPYPTWPFTVVNPADLERWCKRNVKQIKETAQQYEEAPW